MSKATFAEGHRSKLSLTDEPIVISGMSGRFPQSDNIEEFRDQLFSGVNMVKEDDRLWPPGWYGLHTKAGKLKDLASFDASFFGVPAKQAEAMDPQIRIALETTFETLLDSGYNPSELRGSRTGVFFGVSFSEAEEYQLRDPDVINGYGVTGCCRAMLPNRISYSFNFRGPSFAVDTGCSSSIVGLATAVNSIRIGECDAAIVGGVNLILRPVTSLQFHKLNMLSPDGRCMSFDVKANGYARSETVATIFLQKQSAARRIYATILGSQSNADGYKEMGISFPNGEIQKTLIDELYRNAGVDPKDLNYLEAHGTGTQAGDPEELNNAADFFCEGRDAPLLVGSVKSVVGHSEAASGMCSIVKVLLAMEEAVIPANLHYETPNPKIPALFDGRFKVVDKNTPWSGELAGLNSFGFGGANAHVILRCNQRLKEIPLKMELPSLITVSSRTEQTVNSILTKLRKRSSNNGQTALLRDIHKRNITGHPARGFLLRNADGSCTIESASMSGSKRPLWFVFSGMGSQHTEMCRDMMRLPVFAESIQRSAKVLQAEGIDLMDLLLTKDPNTFKNIVNPFVTIAAVQVALVDLLTLLGIEPDGIVGHSLGEIGCAYADGAFTAEQTVLAAYSRGRAVLETELQRGCMAAVGLSWEEALARCPENVFLACHNSKDNVTISGEYEAVVKFVNELTEEGIFARKVETSEIAFHCEHIKDAEPKLKARLDKIIPNPKPRSSRWVSSSIVKSEWNTPLARFSSADYHVNNLVSPVFFNSAMNELPDNAILLEIAPHCLLQAILRRVLPMGTALGLMKKGVPDNVIFALTTIGKLYNLGLQPDIAALYPPVQYPVPRGTPSISPLVQWDRTQQWTVPDFMALTKKGVIEDIIEIDIGDSENEYLSGHTIDGRILFPATGYVVLAWKTLAKLYGENITSFPVELEEIRFERATIIPKHGLVRFSVRIINESGDFIICENKSVVVRGKIHPLQAENTELIELNEDSGPQDAKDFHLENNDVYKDLRLRGYEYTGLFRGIHKADSRGMSGWLKWNDNYISFMDTMMQMAILNENPRVLYVPVRLRKIVINPVKLSEATSNLKDNCIPAYFEREIGVISSGGVQIFGMKPSSIPRRPLEQTPQFERYQFVPYENTTPVDVNTALSILLQIAIENSGGAVKIKIVELTDDQSEAKNIVTLVEREPHITAEITVLSTNLTTEPEKEGINIRCANPSLVNGDASFFLAFGPFKLLPRLASWIRNGGFILTTDAKDNSSFDFEEAGLTFISKQKTVDSTYLLLRKNCDFNPPKTVIRATVDDCDWLDDLKAAMAAKEKFILLCDRRIDGVLGLANCVRREEGGENMRVVWIMDSKCKPFTLNGNFREQLDKDLIMNIYQNGQVGSYRHLELENIGAIFNIEQAYVNTVTQGDLSSLRWLEAAPLQPIDGTDEELCYIYYAALNFKDVMVSLNKITADALPADLLGKECLLGIEFAGRTLDGKRVFGVTEAQAIATTVVTHPDFLWEVPDAWSMQEASTVAVTYTTVYYALCIRANIERRESILIHAGSGGVGIAAITVALSMGCKVFTTVSTPEKKAFLLERFPRLNPMNIGNSRNASFENLILRRTNGMGVNVIMNSLSSEMLQASIRCLSEGGRFLEIGKVDLIGNSKLGMGIFMKNATIHGILFDTLMSRGLVNYKKHRQLVHRLVKEGIETGVVQPIPCTVFDASEVENGFRYMSSGKHIGKVVIRLREEEGNKTARPLALGMVALPRAYFNAKKSYVLIGGLGGFGLELTSWMANRGARKLVLTSRSGIKSSYQSLCIRRLQESGADVVILKDDASEINGAEAILRTAMKLGPVGGIFSLAVIMFDISAPDLVSKNAVAFVPAYEVDFENLNFPPKTQVLKDAAVMNQTREDFEAVCRPKVNVTINLDSLSRKLCPELDYFVAFSSLACGRGNQGQCNYGWANSVMERICEQRQADGYPGLAIQWGAVGDVGILMDALGCDNEKVIGGTLPQRMASCLQSLDVLLKQPHPVVSSMVQAEKRINVGHTSTNRVADAIAKILGLKTSKNLNTAMTMTELGMDSLMATEIQQLLDRNYDVVLTAAEIRNITIDKVEALTQNSMTKTHDLSSTDKTAEIGYTNAVFLPTETILQMNSKDKTSTNPPLFLIHPLEGSVIYLQELASHLHRPVFGLQCSREVPTTSVSSIAEFYWKQIRSVKPMGPYHILGYSFGCLICYEVALLMERAGEIVEIIFIDGSPFYISSAIDEGKIQMQVIDTDSSALAFFASQFTKEGREQLSTRLVSLQSYTDKLRTVAAIIGSSFFEDDVMQAAHTYVQRLKAGNNYKPAGTFNGKVTLIRAKESFVDKALPEDYGLGQVCSKPVSLHVIDTDHRGIIKGGPCEKIASIISTMS